MLANARWQQKELLRDAARLLHDHYVAVETVGLVGDPAAEILRVARERRVGLIVIGRAHRRVFDAVSDSIGPRIIREAPLAVLVVP